VKDIDIVLSESMSKVNEMLSKDYVYYIVEVDGEKFNLAEPFEAEEKLSNEFNKRKYIVSLYQEAFNKLIQEIADNNYVTLERTNAFYNIDSLLSMDVPVEAFISEYSAQDLQDIKDAAANDPIKARPLNLDSVYVNQQRPGWTEEDQEKFIKERNDK
jgi:hypothetical protein